MKELELSELERIKGGFSATVAVAIVSAVIFISQIIEGIVYPRSCSNE